MNLRTQKPMLYVFGLCLFVHSSAFAQAAEINHSLARSLNRIYTQSGIEILICTGVAALLYKLAGRFKIFATMWIKSLIFLVAAAINLTLLYIGCNLYINAYMHYGTKDQITHVVDGLFSPNLPFVLGGNLLHMAIREKHTPAVIMQLVELGTDLEATNDNGDTPLSYAAYNGTSEQIKALVQSGADVNYQNSKDDNFTPLMTIIVHSKMTAKNKEKAVKALIAGGADIDTTNDNGETALFLAALYYDTENTSISLNTIHLLLEGGANPNIKVKQISNNKNCLLTPYLAAKRCKKPELTNLLNQYNIKENTQKEETTN